MVEELIQKYIWLVETFSKAPRGGLSLEEIQDRWERRWGEQYSRRTFCNHREAVARLFEVEIFCNRSTNRYYIDAEALPGEGASRAEWLIDTFTVGSLLSLGKERLSGRVSVENVPSGHRWLLPLMEAMLSCSQVRIIYRKYTGEAESERVLEPYALKEFRKRWYLVGHDSARGVLHVYGLDRIQDITPTGESFNLPDDFDVDVLFADSFGMYASPGSKPMHVVLQATEKESRYLRDLPLHRSQKETGGGIFTLDITGGDDLVMELLSRGDRIKVLEPPQLREAIRDELSKAIKQYD